MQGKSIKLTTLTASLILIITICGCEKDTVTNETNSATMKISYGMTGTTIVEGYVGFFSPELSSDGIPMWFATASFITLSITLMMIPIAISNWDGSDSNGASNVVCKSMK